MSLKLHGILLVVALVYAAAPLLATYAGLKLAEVFGCQAEGIEFTCSQNPWLGGLFTYMVFSHWLAILTVPTGGLAAIVLGFSLLKRLLAR